MAILHMLTCNGLPFGRCKTRAKTVAIQGSGKHSRGSQNNSLSLSSSTDRCADSNHPQHTCWAESPEPARAPCLRVLRPRALPRDSNRLTAPCLHAPDAHLRRAIRAPVAGRGARQLPMAIGPMAAALGASSGTFRRAGRAENDTVHRSPPPARRTGSTPRLGCGDSLQVTAVGPRQPPPRPHREGPLPTPRRPPRPPAARVCPLARCAPHAPHTRSRARDGEPAQVSGSEPSRPPKHTPSPFPHHTTIPHAGRRPRGRRPPPAASQWGRFLATTPRCGDAVRQSGRAGEPLRRPRAGLRGGGHPHGSGGGCRRPGRGGWPRGSPRHRCPCVSMCMLVPTARTVTFNYNCVTVRCPHVYIKISRAISIALDSRDS